MLGHEAGRARRCDARQYVKGDSTTTPSNLVLLHDLFLVPYTQIKKATSCPDRQDVSEPNRK